MMSWLLLQLFSPLVGMLLSTWGAGVACFAVAILAPAWLPFSRMHLIWAGIALMGCGAFYAWAFEAGQKHMAQLVAAKDQAAVERVERAQSRVNDCNGGLDWDVVTGSCKTK
jgi:hypothetical protein